MQKRSIRPLFGFTAPIARFLEQFRREDGAVAVWFAVLALPLAILAFGLIDVNRASVERRRLQDALDAATLLAARSNATTSELIQPIGAAALAAELEGMSDASLTSSTFKVDGTRIIGTASAKLTPFIANLWLRGDMEIGATAEVVRASTNLEVSLVLDITGSMGGTKIDALEVAATELVDYLVQDEALQTPYYSKMAVAPFSIGVNAGGYADAVRGAVRGNATIQSAAWTDASATITGVSRNSPAVVTANNNFADGDTVYISGVEGMTTLNGKIFTVTGRSNGSFKLSGVNSTNYSKYSKGGTVYRCLYPDCTVKVTTTAAHEYINGETIRIRNVNGMTQLNGYFPVSRLASNSFSTGVPGPTSTAYTNGGTSYCVLPGCEYYRFTGSDWTTKEWRITPCVTERVGGDAATDASPATALVGRHYTSNGSGCPNANFIPLTSKKDVLKGLVGNLPATGNTAGQIGIAWGWYLVSPTFNQKPGGGSIWPAESAPAAYTAPKTLKVVIFMTDGEFNQTYCDGVSSGSTNDCNSSNRNSGSATAQAQAICTAIKHSGVVLYTIGFDVGGDATAKKFVEDCATSRDHVYLPSGGGALKDAFAAIGRDIMKLRLAK